MMSVFATAILVVGALAATPEQAQWQADYGDALAATRASAEKPLLVVLDEPQTEETRVQPALLQVEGDSAQDADLLKHYRLCHVDASTPYGKKVAGVFKAHRMPHVAIIDKSGKVVLFKKSGKITTAEWTTALEQHQDGERVVAKHVSYQLDSGAATPVYRNNSYCPSCQRNRW